MVDYYCIHDSDPELKRKGAFKAKESELKILNHEGYGIFFTPNSFYGERKACNLARINYWLADIDGGDKEEQMQRINNLVLEPTTIIESKNGYHCYWKADEATIENYRDIECGIIKKLGADPACKDVCRLLRFPNYYHMKNPKNPFLIKCVYHSGKVYTEEKMLDAFRLPRPAYKPIKYDGDKSDMLNPDKWDKIFRFNQFMADGRNNSLTRVTFWLRDSGFDRGTIEQTIYNMNSRLPQPLDDWEVRSILRGKL